jgi:hypothetical protein
VTLSPSSRVAQPLIDLGSAPTRDLLRESKTLGKETDGFGTSTDPVGYRVKPRHLVTTHERRII